MGTSPSNSKRRKAVILQQLRQSRENRQYKKDKAGVSPKRGVPLDLRSDAVKLRVLNRYIDLAQA